MTPFAEIFARAAARKGGPKALEAILAETPSKTPDEIAATPDDRILALMTRRIFYAGFSWKVIDDKWPAFEDAFFGFDPAACALMSDEHFDAQLKNAAIVRNGAKIRTIQVNAQLIQDLRREHGSAARFFADWPDADYVGLLEILKKQGSHLGGDSGMRFLRMLGKPAFVTSRDVVAALIADGVVAKAPGGKRDMALVQDAFNAWSAESGRDLTAISRTLAMSVDAPDAH
ncbi:DNA-3-methyladenine glycosylase I [Zavarzinia compransoris]|uniref:DNA-3-methyladenine glycosylase I n=1 Tax=Zavarzinia marina TaxID=2911065 RepID=UPI001F226B9E|nr:DNA-3-methyladenine glycosylase I [Zavarzinia marina]MCF4167206.1 DNA-3-methyladenine glycosylase I [Zavarzinia marina]